MANSLPATNLQVSTSYRQILKIALPISLAILVPQFNFITNNIFLGHYSQEALATASITGVYYLIFAMIGFGLNNGLQTLIARRAGENKPEEVGKLFGQGVYISLAIAFVGILITWLLAPVILKAVLHSDTIATDSIEYLKIRIWGLPFLYVYQMRNALLVGTNNSKYLISGAIAETVANVAFDYVLIFGHYGFPEMGLNGAAVASIIAEFIGMVVVFLVIHKKGIGKQFSLFKHFYWNKKLSKQLFAISLPIILQLAFSVMSWEFFYILIEHHGQTDLAISNVMRNVFGLTGCLTWAFAATSSAMVSNIIGQGKQENVKALILKIVKLSTCSALVIVLLINLFPGVLISIFGQSELFIADAIPVVRVVSVAILFMSFSVVWLNAVTGTGNSRMTLLIDGVAIILYCVFVYLILEKYKLSITYGWMGEWIYWGSIFILSVWYINKGNWKNKNI
ncbi:MAG: MATE family efflux transporter [Chitinophagaceae bacterium]|nr:MATE family efflux transporter [Chitinophagaceae bacterium]MBP6478551.1 MATE family efflux transporter [Chitinophagaceae bacterium]MBP7109487.1 MATE family efflux transporter [Chitinophagaceae bacterium]MBP7314215.1 MATE family efflux transporter [Chitinophagaceae bacterium]HRA11825.1 MATE family efflux transporter [Chitinophagaceae bacterium]